MERLTKNTTNVQGHMNIDAFSGAGIFDTIMKGITSKFVKNTAKTLGTKALEVGVNKFGSEIGTSAANKVISAVDKKFSKPPPKSLIESHNSINPLKEVIKVVEVDSDDESSKPLGNVIMKELNTNDNGLTKALNDIHKKQYGYGSSNKQFKNKLNKLLK